MTDRELIDRLNKTGAIMVNTDCLSCTLLADIAELTQLNKEAASRLEQLTDGITDLIRNYSQR